MFKHVLASSVVILASVSSVFADRGARYYGHSSGGHSYDSHSHSSVSVGFGFSSSNYYGGGSYFGIGFSSGGYAPYAPAYGNYCSTPAYYSAPRPVYCEPQTVIVARPRPVYVAPPVYVQPPIVYQSAPVAVYPSRGYYYSPCPPGGDIYYRSSAHYYYGH